MEQEDKKDGDYALNTLKDIWKYDPARLLDLGNDFQVLLSSNKPEIDEERRASSNFEKLTEDRRRPISHTLVDAARVLPDIILLAAPALIKGGSKAIGKAFGKAVTKGATKDVAKKLVNEGTSDAAKALSKSKFLPRDEKVMAGKKWVRYLLENKDAMERVAGKKLSDKEVEGIRKNINKLVPNKIDTYNADVDKLKDILKRLNIKGKFDTKDDLVKYLSTNKKSLGLTDTEYKNLIKNIDVLPDAKISNAHLPVDRIIEKEKKMSTPLENIRELAPGPIHSSLIGADATLKAADAGINKMGKINFQTNKELEMKPDYWTLGSEPTPVSDFIASVFNVDFNDPARFNKKDIDTFFEFLEDAGYIEPGIKDKWTPRQKVSVMREILSDKIINEYVKEKWANSEHKKNLNKYYMGE
jgi:hypothetical protein